MKRWRVSPAAGLIFLFLAALPAALAGAAIAGEVMLRRVDFRVEGTRCAACLIGIQDKILSFKGVVKAEVNYQEPFQAVVIYDSRVVSEKKLRRKIEKCQRDVGFVDYRDRAIDSVPAVLIEKPEVKLSPRLKTEDL